MKNIFNSWFRKEKPEVEESNKENQEEEKTPQTREEVKNRIEEILNWAAEEKRKIDSGERDVEDHILMQAHLAAMPPKEISSAEKKEIRKLAFADAITVKILEKNLLLREWNEENDYIIEKFMYHESFDEQVISRFDLFKKIEEAIEYAYENNEEKQKRFLQEFQEYYSQ
jgi:hypothetical protein